MDIVDLLFYSVLDSFNLKNAKGRLVAAHHWDRPRAHVGEARVRRHRLERRAALARRRAVRLRAGHPGVPDLPGPETAIFGC